MADPATRLTAQGRRRLQVAAVALVLIGVVLVVGSFYLFIRNAEADFRNFPYGPQHSMAPTMMAFILGGILTLAGGSLAAVAFIRPVSGIYVTEAEPAIAVASRTIGEGLRAGLGPASTGVRVKCGSCGFLESEDAKYCSRCSKAL